MRFRRTVSFLFAAFVMSGAGSVSVSAALDKPPPLAAPTGVRAEMTDRYTAYVTWNPVSTTSNHPVDQYQVLSIPKTKPCIVGWWMVGATGCIFNLPSGTTYKFVAYAIDDFRTTSKASNASNPVTFASPDGSPYWWDGSPYAVQRMPSVVAGPISPAQGIPGLQQIPLSPPTVRLISAGKLANGELEFRIRSVHRYPLALVLDLTRDGSELPVWRSRVKDRSVDAFNGSTLDIRTKSRRIGAGSYQICVQGIEDGGHRYDPQNVTTFHEVDIARSEQNCSRFFVKVMPKKPKPTKPASSIAGAEASTGSVEGSSSAQSIVVNIPIIH